MPGGAGQAAAWGGMLAGTGGCGQSIAASAVAAPWSPVAPVHAGRCLWAFGLGSWLNLRLYFQ